ncbi:NblA/ycf18 family protein [[Leptolyngbya] sp. PCC 7376]|uniref:NblA/ycf18 family protein n=1 Tax=[Leptolyngbya] sp. PCC 7376 TaxID=111781 RepID=UPI001CEC5AAB|nr:NblA/ycf18 family protein [[Leptolyngbya] sp. PCC 7376]
MYSETYMAIATSLKRSKVMSSENPLSIDQRLKVQLFEARARNLSLEQTQEFLLELFRQNMVKENLLSKLAEG